MCLTNDAILGSSDNNNRTKPSHVSRDVFFPDISSPLVFVRLTAPDISLDYICPEHIRGPPTLPKRSIMTVLKCTNQACGKEFEEDDNQDNSCAYHPGGPVCSLSIVHRACTF